MLASQARRVLAVAVAVGLVGIAGWMASVSLWSGSPVDHDAPPSLSTRFTVDINSAAAEELSALPGIGPTTAARIVEKRGEAGGFRSPNELLDIPGIGAATLDRLRPHLRPIRPSREDAP